MMIIFWLTLSALMTSACWLIYLKLHVPGRMTQASWALAISSVLCIGFMIAWAVASINEGEIRAAGSGLLVFGLLSVVLVSFTRKFIPASQS